MNRATNTRTRALHGIFGAVTSALGWGWTRRRYGTPAAALISGIHAFYFLGTPEWITWGVEKAREGVELYDAVNETVEEYKAAMKKSSIREAKAFENSEGVDAKGDVKFVGTLVRAR